MALFLKLPATRKHEPKAKVSSLCAWPPVVYPDEPPFLQPYLQDIGVALSKILLEVELANNSAIRRPGSHARPQTSEAPRPKGGAS